MCVARGTSTRQWPEARTDTAQGLTWPRKTGATGLDPKYWMSQGPYPTGVLSVKGFSSQKKKWRSGCLQLSAQHKRKVWNSQEIINNNNYTHNSCPLWGAAECLAPCISVNPHHHPRPGRRAGGRAVSPHSYHPHFTDGHRGLRKLSDRQRAGKGRTETQHFPLWGRRGEGLAQGPKEQDPEGPGGPRPGSSLTW